MMENPLAVRAFLSVEAAAFVGASLIHRGILVEGLRHQQAGTAEAVIAVALLLGLALTWAPPPWALRAAIAAQAFALLGVLVGLFTIAIGVGPRTAPDLAYHAGILVVLAVGLVVMWRRRAVTTAS